MSARSEIAWLLEETARLFEARRLARITHAPQREQAEARRQHVAACQRLAEAQSAAVQKFADSRGWCVGKPPRVNRDYPVLDHTEILLRPDQKKAALVTHCYAAPEEVAHWATQHDYRVEPLAWSWWAPGVADAYLLVPHSGETEVRHGR